MFHVDSVLCLLLSGYLPTDILAVVVLWPPVFADVAFCSVLCCICLLFMYSCSLACGSFVWLMLFEFCGYALVAWYLGYILWLDVLDGCFDLQLCIVVVLLTAMEVVCV